MFIHSKTPRKRFSGCWYSAFETVGRSVAAGMTQQGNGFTYTEETCVDACAESPTCYSCNWNNVGRTCSFGNAQFPATDPYFVVDNWDIVRVCNSGKFTLIVCDFVYCC